MDILKTSESIKPLLQLLKKAKESGKIDGFSIGTHSIVCLDNEQGTETAGGYEYHYPNEFFIISFFKADGRTSYKLRKEFWTKTDDFSISVAIVGMSAVLKQKEIFIIK